MTEPVRLGASFRDPSGFVFSRTGELLRQVNRPALEDLEELHKSGLYDELVGAHLLIPHERVDLSLAASPEATAVLRPEHVATISYPYEWCFSQWQDAALVTLDIHRRALAKGMALKDASAFNIQFHRGNPVLIDTLSLERYREGVPWVAYRQFCRHFLAPLALQAFVDPRLSAMLMNASLDGIPLDLASRLLPKKTRWMPGLLIHVHMHGKVENQSASVDTAKPKPKLVKTALLGLVDSLDKVIRNLHWEPKGTEWGDYYSDNNYTDAAMAEKHRLVDSMIDSISPEPTTLWDLGANTGEFSRVASAKGIRTVAWDIDPAAVELAYRAVRESGEVNLLPLRQDLMNPSPNLGWAERERDSFLSRGPVDAMMALALIHHLAIANNVPLIDIASYFSRVARWAIVEWVPKEDSQVKRLLASREDVFDGYHEAGFESAFATEFETIRKESIPGTSRILYLVRRCR